MSGKKLGSFSAFDGATAPVSPAAEPETPATAPAGGQAPERPATPAQARQRAETPTQPPAPARPELSKAEQRRILHRVGAAAGKLAAVRQRLDEAEEAWAYEVADARRAGLDERMLLGTALSAGVDLPEAATGPE